MKRLVLSAILMFAAPSMAATLVLKDGKVPANAQTVLRMEATASVDLKFEREGNGEDGTVFKATGGTYKTGGKASMTVGGQTQNQTIPTEVQDIKGDGKIIIGKNYVRSVSDEGTLELKAFVFRHAGRIVKAEVSASEALNMSRSLAQQELLETLLAEESLISLKLDGSAFLCSEGKKELRCTLSVKLNAVLAE